MPKSTPPTDVASAIAEEALAVARATRKPEQTKEQTRLIAQGIAKGIEHYKRQQSAKARERDKSRKRLEKARSQNSGAQIDAEPGLDRASPVQIRTALVVCGILLLTLSLLHVIPLLAGWRIAIGAWTLPAGLSLLVAVLLASLAGWALLTAYHYHRDMTSS